jgi:putative transposase
MERLFRNKKKEWIPATGYPSFIETENTIISYFIGYYTQVRLHSYNGGLTSDKSEKRYWLEYKSMTTIS